MFYTYILYSSSKDKFYIGSSENPPERLKKHNNKNKGFTNQTHDWKIVFTQGFDTRAEAMAFEKKIKNWKSRSMIQKLIDSLGSECPDML
ncbi:Excinuclease ABC C subunit domain protein [Fluviicola taffensis DSM 16823]|uniref:Excinuclease ABC C subunit domain protein n=1 Tax=Fluviicola taffensis (strain DSM 16823 / NCIMB 13979 / RW262) TaxID=755732 RepID=F2IEI2_FLUTR|nr:Excinuclease ABC C subunit domain protein [Fluviicola taffensis DSM 16823]